MIRVAAVFPGGYTLADDDDTRSLYDGVADGAIALATGGRRNMPAQLEARGAAGNLIDCAALSNIVRCVAWPRPS